MSLLAGMLADILGGIATAATLTAGSWSLRRLRRRRAARRPDATGERPHG